LTSDIPTVSADANPPPLSVLNCTLLEFKGHRRAWRINPLLVPLSVGDVAIVEADRGEDAGTVRAMLDHNPDLRQPSEFRVLRKAVETDLARIERHRKWESEAFAICESKISRRQLPMFLIDAEYRFDELKLTFYFTADGRIDFRELVRDLAAAFRTRIELRQIGARDEIKRSDGFGLCGRRLCCVCFMDSFQPITTNMAKRQKLILNPAKLSGTCGRLKCCLAFEDDDYELEEASGGEYNIPLDPEGRQIEQLSD